MSASTPPVFRPAPEARSTEDHIVEEERITTVLHDDLLARADRIHAQFPAARGDTYGHALRIAANDGCRP